MNMAAADAGNVINLVDQNTHVPQMRNENCVVRATQRRMGLLCRTKIIFHAQMNLDVSTLEPASTTFGQFVRLRQLGHAEDVNVEAPCAILSTSRHSELNVIDGSKWRSGHSHAERSYFIACECRGLTPEVGSLMSDA